MKKSLLLIAILTLMITLASCAGRKDGEYNYRGEPTEKPVFIMFTSPT